MKTILITGANKGIGFETAKQLAALGHFIYIGSRNLNNGLAAVQQLHDQNLPNTAALEIDVTNPASIQKAAAELAAKTNTLDILINNAAIAGPQPQSFANSNPKDLRDTFETNFFGAIQTTQHFLPLLRQSPAASIINVSSEVGSLTMHSPTNRNPNRSRFHLYGASKTALNAFTVMLANELRDDHICVNSVTPGYTATDLNQFQGLKTAEQGAKAIVALATLEDRTITGKFFKEGGEVEW
ncbi:MAG: SDR family oxidoreductase [Bacteroidetes bacterium]|nr:SDR family oxidoreductase [Bacteroidota bacterium]